MLQINSQKLKEMLENIKKEEHPDNYYKIYYDFGTNEIWYDIFANDQSFNKYSDENIHFVYGDYCRNRPTLEELETAIDYTYRLYV